MDVADKTVTFLLDTRAEYFVFTCFSRHLSSQFCIVLGVAGKPTTKNFTLPLRCLWNRYYFAHCFLVVLECLTPAGGDLLQLLGTRIIIGAALH